MLTTLFKGFAISGGLIVSIGAQNAFLLKQGLLKTHIFWVALLCFVCDFALISIGVMGVGSILNRNPALSAMLSLAGAVFLFLFGLHSFQAAFTKQHAALTSDENGNKSSLKTTLFTTLGVTLLNPQVYLESLMVIGGMATTLSFHAKLWFLFGAVSASFLWFFGVGYGARLLKPLFAKPRAWQVLECLTGVIMWWLTFDLLRFVWTWAETVLS